METIDHVTLNRLIEANAVREAQIVGQTGGWGVVVKYGLHERVLAARRGKVRLFAKFETLVAYLKKMGLSRYQVDASDFNTSNDHPMRRIAARDRMKAAHEAAEYDKWFREQVQIGLTEADSPTAEWVTNDEAEASWAKKRAALLKVAKVSAA